MIFQKKVWLELVYTKAIKKLVDFREQLKNILFIKIQ